MLVSDFDFDLPSELIAQEPHARGTSRLLVIDRRAERWDEASIGDLPSLLARGDLVVANDTRVFPARLIGRRLPGGGASECLLLERVAEDEWDALVHPGQRLKLGSRIVIEDHARAPGVQIAIEILAERFFGRRRVRLEAEGAETVDAAVDALGHIPLPPYIHRPDTSDDRVSYQTVFAETRGSIAAPTAGLHFDDRIIRELGANGIGWQTLTLHVGYGTFKPVRSETVEEHVVDAEHYEISQGTATAIQDTRAAGHRVVAVGTTTTRALEDAAGRDAGLAGTGNAEIFIAPRHQFRVVDALLTNFHLPRSSLMMLVAAFAGRELILAAYRHAIERKFRFYSYGDATLIV